MTRNLTLALMTLGLATLACGGGGGGSSSPTAPPPGGGQTVTVQVLDNSFNPRSLTVSPGDTVRWVMMGSNPGHTATANSGRFDSGFVFNGANDSYQVTFSTADNNQTFEYKCSSHDACCLMRGSVRVGQSSPPPDPGYE